MPILPIFLYGSEILRAKARLVKELTPEIDKLVYDMFHTMSAANGIGLAATQVGQLHRIIVVDISGMEEEETSEQAPDATKKNLRKTSAGLPRSLALINPEIVSSQGSWGMEEGCLSIPDVRAEVERAEKIRVRFRDANFREDEIEADGMLARVILHETDHLDGVLFVDRISVAKRSLLRPALRKIKKGEVETSYPVVNAVEV